MSRQSPLEVDSAVGAGCRVRYLVDCSLPGSSVHGIFQARILECVAISFSRASSPPRIKPLSPTSPALADGFFTCRATGASFEI